MVRKNRNKKKAAETTGGSGQGGRTIPGVDAPTPPQPRNPPVQNLMAPALPNQPQTARSPPDATPIPIHNPLNCHTTTPDQTSSTAWVREGHRAWRTSQTPPSTPAGGQAASAPTNQPQAPIHTTSLTDRTRPSATQTASPGTVPANPAPEQALASSFVSMLNNPKPPSGSEGTAVTVLTNQFRSNLDDVKLIYRYDVKIKPVHTVNRGGATANASPNLTARKTRRLLRLLLQRDEFDQAATDYAQHIVSLKPLTQHGAVEQFIVDMLDVNQTQQNAGGPPRNWQITLSPTQVDHILDVQPLLASSSGNTICDKQTSILNSLNLMVTRRPLQSNELTLVGKDRIFPNNPPGNETEKMYRGLVAKHGFSRSVRALKSGVFLQINTSAAAFYPGVNLEVLLWDSDYGNKVDEMSRFVRGLQVITKYGTPRLHSVWGLAKSTVEGTYPNPENVHFDRSGARTSVGTYFKDVLGEYKFREDTTVVNVGSGDHPVYIPATLLDVLPVNPYRHLLDPEQTGKMVKFAARSAEATSGHIMQGGKQIFGIDGGRHDVDSLANRFQIHVNPEMLSINARRFANPRLEYYPEAAGKGSTKRKLIFQPPMDANWTLRDKFFPKVAKVPQCAWIEFHNGQPAFDEWRGKWVKALERGVQNYCSTTGTQATVRPVFHNLRDNSIAFPRNWEDLASVFNQAKKDLFDIVFVLLPDKSAKTYDMLKKTADFRVGIHTICTTITKPWHVGMTDRNGNLVPQIKNGGDYIGNVMLKVNLKMGGVNTNLVLDPTKDAHIRSLLSPETMIVGADVTHPGPGSMKGANSIAAVVGSIEATFSQYPASIECQESKKEMIGNLNNMLEERLEAWSRHNSPPGTKDKTGALPEQILFFRDGVAETQYQTICDEELPLVERAFKKTYGNRGLRFPKLLFVCIVKRVHTRFFPVDKHKGRWGNHPDIDKRNGNSWPGLVVDTNITYPRGYDFYLQSQKALQGTAKPAHYVVIVDDIKVSPDTLQKAIFWQCWTFQRSTKPISIHPAARLADRACNRARSYLRECLVGQDFGTVMDRQGAQRDAWIRGVHKDLENSTFYL